MCIGAHPSKESAHPLATSWSKGEEAFAATEVKVKAYLTKRVSEFDSTEFARAVRAYTTEQARQIQEHGFWTWLKNKVIAALYWLRHVLALVGNFLAGKMFDDILDTLIAN